MKSRAMQKIAGTVGVAFAIMLFPALASAGCGSYNPGQPMHPGSGSAAPQEQSQAESSSPWHSDGRESIVGMWKVLFTATDGSGYTDFGYSQWHEDNTEILNSGSRAPATQNYCLGVWEKTGEAKYQLNHFALSYDQTSGVLNGKVNIREEVTVSADEYKYHGTFTIDVYDPTGTTVVAHFQGKITGARVTVSTLTP